VASVIAVEADTFKLLSVNRGPDEPRFSAADVQLIGFFVPHVRRALQIQQRIVDLEAQRVTVPRPNECAASLGLTKATFVTLLVSGLSVKDICSRLQIQMTTARTHLRHLYEKTNTTRQAELVSYVLRECDRTGRRPRRAFGVRSSDTRLDRS
jgi:Bacterial regulatory proteins, luxR family